MTVSLAEHTASPYVFTAVQRYTSVSSPVSLLICREAQGRGWVSTSLGCVSGHGSVRGAQIPRRQLDHRGGEDRLCHRRPEEPAFPGRAAGA